jgi:phosphoglycolate phosphatase
MDTPVKNFYSKIFDLNRHSMEMLDNEWCVLYNKFSHKIGLHNGVENILDVFNSQNCRQVVLSAFRTDEILKYAKKFEVEQYFDNVLGTDNIVMESKTLRGKKYMKENGFEPENTLYIGDTVHDYETATALGTDCVLFSCGQQSPKLLHQCGVPVYDSFEKLKNDLLLSNR